MTRKYGRTEVSQCFDLFCHAQPLVVVDAWLFGLLVVGVIVIFLFPQIALECDEHEFNVRAVFRNLANPLGLYVFKRIRRVDLTWLVVVRRAQGCVVAPRSRA